MPGPESAASLPPLPILTPLTLWPSLNAGFRGIWENLAGGPGLSGQALRGPGAGG